MVNVNYFSNHYDGFKAAVLDLGARKEVVFAELGQNAFAVVASVPDSQFIVVFQALEKPPTFEQDFPKAVRADGINFS